MMSLYNCHFTPSRPHFFQIILQDGDAIRQKKLWIPRRFMRLYGREILKHVQVKDPSGKIWNLEWSKSDGEIWFKKDWEEFADYYSLKHGHLLLFEYEGYSHFSVIILDMSATEIVYPTDWTDVKAEEVKKEAEEESEVPLEDSTRLSRKRKKSSIKCSSKSPKMMRKDSVENSEGREMGFNHKKKIVKELPLRCRGRPKVRRTSLPSKPVSNSKLHTSSSDKGGNKSVFCRKHRGNGIREPTRVLREDINAEDFPEAGAAAKSRSNNLKNVRRNTCRASDSQEFTTLTSLNKSRDFKKVIGLKSENLSFDVVMKPAYVSGKYMVVPIQFARYLFKERSGNVILQNSEGKTWIVSYIMYNEYSYARLSIGWAAFVRENNLTTGMKCIFELLDPAELLLKVVIDRVSTCKERSKQRLRDRRCRLSSKDVTKLTGKQSMRKKKAGRQCLERPSHSQVPEVDEVANKFTSLYPSFIVSLRSCHLKDGVTVPTEFMEHIKQGAKNDWMLQLQVEEKRWPVKLFFYPQYSVRKLLSGWSAFSRENFLQVGDICAFELVDGESLLLKVTIFRLDG